MMILDIGSNTRLPQNKMCRNTITLCEYNEIITITGCYIQSYLAQVQIQFIQKDAKRKKITHLTICLEQCAKAKNKKLPYFDTNDGPLAQLYLFLILHFMLNHCYN